MTKKATGYNSAGASAYANWNPIYKGVGGASLTWASLIAGLDNVVFAGRASATSYTTSDGNDINVNQWTDESGNDLHAIAGSSARYPNFDADGVAAGQAGFVFDGVDNKLQCVNAGIGNSFVELSDTVTVHWYGKFDLTGSAHNGLFEIGDGALNTGAQVYVHGTTDNMMIRAFQKDSSYIYSEIDVSDYDGDVHLWTFKYDMPNDDITVLVDGVDIGITVTRSDGTTDAEEFADDIDTISVGNPHTGFDFKGAIGMFLVTSDLTTGSEDADVYTIASGGAYSNITLPPRYVVVGDSLSVDPASGGYDPAWTSILEDDNTGVTIVNEAIAGQTLDTIDGAYVSQVGANFKSAATSNNLIIWGGTNDIATGRTPAQVQASIDSIVSKASTTGYDAIYVCSIIDRHPNSYDHDISTANGLIAAGSGYTKIDLAGRAELDNGSDTTYFYDGVHLKEAGHVAVADEIASVTGLN